jgi:hypothetical protein
VEQTGRGWDSDLPRFVDEDRKVILASLRKLLPDASESQVRAWRDSLPPLQTEGRALLTSETAASTYGTILEYVMPMESRRPDFLLLVDGAVIVIELKGKEQATIADIDQVAAYARDLRCYHRDCEGQPVQPILVPTRMQGRHTDDGNVIVCGPNALEELIRGLPRKRQVPTPVGQFLDESAYRPLPTLVAAARELLLTGNVRRVTRAAAATEPTVSLIRDIAFEAAATKTRRLVLVTGVPGAGKTLVGLQTVHARWLDALAVARNGEKPTAPGVFLSGNGPLVAVLQYELTQGAADGKTFVRGVKEYVKRYSSRRNPIPPEHVLVFDEAQRAWDRDKVAKEHGLDPSAAKSEPELFLEFAERIPDWCVVVGLIGGGQEIHKGEEAGIEQWREAVAKSARSKEWTIHAPGHLASRVQFPGRLPMVNDRLNLTTELRFHLAKHVHQFVAGLLDGHPTDSLAKMAIDLEASGYHLRITRSLDTARHYLWDRYAEEPDKRFGLIASSRDRMLAAECGIKNDFQSTKRIRFGPWYADPQDHPAGRSCRLLQDVVTEFGAQGLELDAALLAWGSDYLREQRSTGSLCWSSRHAARYKSDGVAVRDPHQLRLNSYRVLLTRGREATVVFVPEVPLLDTTFDYLQAAGFRLL